MAELGVEYNGPMFVSLGWLIIYYTYMQCTAVLGVTVKDYPEAQKTWADRSFMNMGEQAPAFLLSLWVHTFYVSPESATTVGTVYLLTRILYGILRFKAKGAMGMDVVMACTVPGYSMNFYLLGSSALVRMGMDVFANPLWAFACFPISMAWFMTATACMKMTMNWFKSGPASDTAPLAPI